jgi:hypothetical protein
MVFIDNASMSTFSTLSLTYVLVRVTALCRLQGYACALARQSGSHDEISPSHAALLVYERRVTI